MTEVENVALWSGLIGSIVSIVLSIVAIWFAVYVNRRSNEVSDRTIQSLQKIESTIERMSDETSGLIKAAWEKLLGNVGASEPSGTGKSDAKAVASGLASEVKAALADSEGAGNAPVGQEYADRIENAVVGLERTLEALLRAQPAAAGRRAISLDRLVGVTRRLSPRALAVVHSIRKAHLTRAEYQALVHDEDAKGTMLELRKRGLVIPLDGGEDAPVYWFPPGFARVMPTALKLAPAVTPDAREWAIKKLGDVGYQYAVE